MHHKIRRLTGFTTEINLTMCSVMKKQLSFFLARAQIPVHWVHTAEGQDAEGEGPAPQISDDVLECLGNAKLSAHFRNFGKAVGVEESRSVEDIYKAHLEPTRSTQSTDSARNNLASTFVNAFVNAGFGNDKLMVNAAEGQSWIYKNKDEGMMSATASIGMSMLWDSEAGIDHIDKYSYSSEEQIKAGAFLAMGILHSGIRTDPDVAFALLEEHVDNKSVPLKVSAMNGIAVAYAGSYRQDIAQKILPHVADDTNTMEVAAMAALALGFVFVGSGDGEIASAILQTLMERDEAQLNSEWSVFMGLALGLVFLGEWMIAAVHSHLVDVKKAHKTHPRRLLRPSEPSSIRSPDPLKSSWMFAPLLVQGTFSKCRRCCTSALSMLKRLRRRSLLRQMQRIEQTVRRMERMEWTHKGMSRCRVLSRPKMRLSLPRNRTHLHQVRRLIKGMRKKRNRSHYYIRLWRLSVLH